MRWWHLALIAAAAVPLIGCQSNQNPSCSLIGGTSLSTTAPWPCFRADTANSGRSPDDVDLTTTTGNGRLLFDRYCSGTTSQACTRDEDCLTAATPQPTPTGQTCLIPKHCSVTRTLPCGGDGDCPTGEFCAVPIGPIAGAPAVGPPSMNGEPAVYLGSTDGNVYVLNPPLGVGTIAQIMRVPGSILGSPLLGADNTVFVGGSGELVRFETDGQQMNLALLTGIVSASPNIWEDGTVYLATQSGLFNGVCPNGIHRFSPLLLAPSQSTAAVVQDPNVDPSTEMTSIEIVGSLGGQVRAYNIRGRTYWSFFASASVVSAVVIDEDTNIFYVADTSGRVFAGQVANGLPVPGFGGFQTASAASITASPALGRSNPAPKLSKLYVADEGRRHCSGDTVQVCDMDADCPTGETCLVATGTLYALDRATGAVCWTFQADGPISSSPVVATGGDHDVVVFGADVDEILDPVVGPVATGGRVYAVPDRVDDRCDGSPRCDGEADCPLWVFNPGFSIGTASPSIGGPDRRTVYIGRAGSRRGVDDECPTAAPCVVNEGGAVYIIEP